MRKVIYKVGRDGYYTNCSTYASALKQKEQDSNYTIETVLVEVAETPSELAPKRKAMLEEKGMVVAK